MLTAYLLTAYLLLIYCLLTAYLLLTYSYLIKDYSLLVHSSLLQNEILGTQIEDFKEASEVRRILSPVPASRNILAVCALCRVIHTARHRVWVFHSVA